MVQQYPGALLTLVLPGPTGRSLAGLGGADDVITAAEQVIAAAMRPHRR